MVARPVGALKPGTEITLRATVTHPGGMLVGLSLAEDELIWVPCGTAVVEH